MYYALIIVAIQYVHVFNINCYIKIVTSILYYCNEVHVYVAETWNILSALPRNKHTMNSCTGICQTWKHA